MGFVRFLTKIVLFVFIASFLKADAQNGRPGEGNPSRHPEGLPGGPPGQHQFFHASSTLHRVARSPQNGRPGEGNQAKYPGGSPGGPPGQHQFFHGSSSLHRAARSPQNGNPPDIMYGSHPRGPPPPHHWKPHAPPSEGDEPQTDTNA